MKKLIISLVFVIVFAFAIPAFSVANEFSSSDDSTVAIEQPVAVEETTTTEPEYSEESSDAPEFEGISQEEVTDEESVETTCDDCEDLLASVEQMNTDLNAYMNALQVANTKLEYLGATGFYPEDNIELWSSDEYTESMLSVVSTSTVN